MSKREFVQLAHTFDPKKHRIGGWYASEKLDGMRAYWDGGWTRGELTSQVPFANTVKDYRRLNPVRSTGLWSRYGKPIAAPDWWLNDLPDFPLDGELYRGRGNFQKVMSTVKKFSPVDDEWEHIDYCIFDIPSNFAFLRDGTINNPQWTVTFEGIVGPSGRYGPMSFHKICRMFELGKITLGSGPAIWQTQVRLPLQTDAANSAFATFLTDVTDRGGEGLMLRKPESVWTPIRTWDLLKVKPWLDSKALVTGYTWGSGEDEGLMGAVIVQWGDKIFKLSGSGFTDEERRMLGTGVAVPGTPAGQLDTCPAFVRGSTVPFRYRELTEDGIPKEARYWRK